MYEIPDEGEISPDCQFSGPGSAGSGNKLDILEGDSRKVFIFLDDNDGDVCCNNFLQESVQLKVKTGPQKKPPGFQAQLVCLTPSNNGEPPGQITALSINSSYGL